MTERPRPISEYERRFAQLPAAVRDYVMLDKVLKISVGIPPDRISFLTTERKKLYAFMTPIEREELSEFNHFVRKTQQKPGGI